MKTRTGRALVYAEYAIAAVGGVVMPVADPAIARPYVLNGALLVTRKVTVRPTFDSGTADYTYGPWRQMRALGAAA